MFGLMRKEKHNKEVFDLEISIRNLVRENKMVGLRNKINLLKSLEKEISSMAGSATGALSPFRKSLKTKRLVLEKKWKELDEQFK